MHALCESVCGVSVCGLMHPGKSSLDRDSNTKSCPKREGHLANDFLFFLNFFSLQMQIGLPITGKYRDPESDQYYNNNNVCIYYLHIEIERALCHCHFRNLPIFFFLAR